MFSGFGSSAHRGRSFSVGLCMMSVAYISLAACAGAPSLTDQCTLEPAAGWVHLAAPPSEADQLLNIVFKVKTVRAQLGPKNPSQDETWFRSKVGGLRYCRYTPKVNPCKGNPVTADFVLVNGKWTTEGALETICVDATKHSQQVLPETQ
jgi:hypothetical protein